MWPNCAGVKEVYREGAAATGHTFWQYSLPTGSHIASSTTRRARFQRGNCSFAPLRSLIISNFSSWNCIAWHVHNVPQQTPPNTFTHFNGQHTHAHARTGAHDENRENASKAQKQAVGKHSSGAAGQPSVSFVLWSR